MNRRSLVYLSFALLACINADGARADDTPLEQRVTHADAENDDVRLHYGTLGEGPLIVMLHGLPDYWYTWRNQMDALAHDHQVVAMDLRGDNRSDKPRGVEQFDMSLLIADVAAVINHAGHRRATIVGHDWGGAIAWYFAMFRHDTTTPPMPAVKAPVLMVHGLDDQALLASGPNDTWEWVERDLTIVTIPNAGHLVQHDAADLVTRSMMMWLHR